jgi:gamma-glutamylcyclotransferase (GGCT)/AIG2-like uncharacterized protein YtfP
MTAALYFAYGSNMDPGQMEIRCPDARALGQARLVDWEVRIGGRGFATVVNALGSETWGVLWVVSPSDVRSLDHYEGVADGHYRREFLTIEGPEGAHGALIYIQEFDGDGVPRHGYLERILDGARAFDLPLDYCAKLARLGQVDGRGREE